MSTYVVGDIHGCYQSLIALLDHCELTLKDQIWCVGDLINRGPDSLKVIEWAMLNEHQVKVILGNHELHYLACLFGAKTASNDTLDPLLTVSEKDQRDILTWLRSRPLLHESSIKGQHVAMVHAGVNSEWRWSEVRSRAQRAEAALRTDEGLIALAKAHPSRKRPKQKESTTDHVKEIPVERAEWIEDLKWLTRVRAIDKNNKPIGWFKGEPSDLPETISPWYERYGEVIRRREKTDEWPDLLCYGHWAAFGIQGHQSTYGLDSGCIWGRHLSALRIEGRQLYQVETMEMPLVPKNLR